MKPQSESTPEDSLSGVGPMEVEIKLRPASVESAIAAIHGLGYREIEQRSFEANVLYDTGSHDLRRSQKALRLRDYHGTAVLTFKGPPVEGKHKQREELETTVGSSARFAAILDRLGYHAMFRYEKYRSVYGREGEPGVITVDETPLGPFLELEGEAEWIDQTATKLGFGPNDYITASYASLYVEHCRQLGVEPTDFVFESAGPKGPAKNTSS